MFENEFWQFIFFAFSGFGTTLIILFIEGLRTRGKKNPEQALKGATPGSHPHHTSNLRKNPLNNAGVGFLAGMYLSGTRKEPGPKETVQSSLLDVMDDYPDAPFEGSFKGGHADPIPREDSGNPEMPTGAGVEIPQVDLPQDFDTDITLGVPEGAVEISFLDNLDSI
jgi:hypothetical protein